jgi:hypothetical protein
VNKEAPYWKDASKGAMRRAAHWLATNVGEGQKFSKAQLRKAIPDIEQVDRRARDLRKYGWVINNYRDGPPGLRPDELRVAKIGDRIWELDYKAPKGDSVSAKTKRRVFDRDNNRCVVCGIGAGEEYPTLPGTHARLTVGHLNPKARKGLNDPDNLRTECSICNEPSRHLTAAPVDVDLLKAQLRELARADKQRLMDWIATGHRTFPEVDRIWMQIRQLPAPKRDEVRKLLEQLTGFPGA